MARKHKLRVEMTFADESEIVAFNGLCEALGKSGSDVLRHAVNTAYGLKWPEPLWRKDESEIKPASVARREARAKKKAEGG